MQLFNKVAAKKSLVHTWYIYPILVTISTLLWVWGFGAFHQPSAHQKLTLFFATDITNESFLKDIQSEHYSRETLREVSAYSSLPSMGSAYYQKLKLYISNSDILVLDENTLDELSVALDKAFVPFTNEVKTKYLFNGNSYYSVDDKDYGVLIKKKGEPSYYSSFMTFEEERDYYLTLSLSSSNLGKMLDESNEKFDNALTFMHYLIEKSL